jgi:hypothetical protein
VNSEDSPETGFEPAALFRLLMEEIAAAPARTVRTAEERERSGSANTATERRAGFRQDFTVTNGITRCTT